MAVGLLSESVSVLVANPTAALSDGETLSVAITIWPAELEATDVLPGVDVEKLLLSVADACPGTKSEEDDDDESSSDEDCELASVEVDSVELLGSIAGDDAVKLVTLSLTMELSTDPYVVELEVV